MVRISSLPTKVHGLLSRRVQWKLPCLVTAFVKRQAYTDGTARLVGFLLIVFVLFESLLGNKREADLHGLMSK
jgi:hypothetical protein